MQGPSLNTLQNDGVHGWPSSTLQGACEDGVASIWRRDWASAGHIPTTIRVRHAMKNRSMRRSLGDGLVNLMSAMVGIKVGCEHFRAFTAELSTIRPSSLVVSVTC